ncbi:hypothetical protein U1Q18_019809 [Sarracenia purpurea var. burkii]
MICRFWGDERSRVVHPGRPKDLRHPARNLDGNPQRLLPPRLHRCRQNLGLYWSPLHHRPRFRYLLCRSSPHGLCHQLCLPHVRPLGRQISVGFALMIALVYSVEVSPASSRGFLTSFPEVFINADFRDVRNDGIDVETLLEEVNSDADDEDVTDGGRQVEEELLSNVQHRRSRFVQPENL